MNSTLVHLSRALTVVGATLALATTALADPPTDACERALVSRIQNENRNAGRVQLDGGMRRNREEGKGSSGFNGNGHWKNSKGGTEHFNYVCNYDHKDQRVRSVSYQRDDERERADRARENDARARANDQRERATRDNATRSKIRDDCRTELRAILKKDHKNATKLDFSDAREWQQSKNETGFKADGSFVNGAGEKRFFGWSCSYDTRSGRIAKLNYEKPLSKKQAAKN